MTARLEYVPLSEVQRWPRNPKGHDLAALTSSIERHGFVSPLIIDEQSGRLVAGHGRLEALLGMKASDQPVPTGIVADEHDWHVPVIRGIAFADAAAAEAYLLADNRLVELGGWDRAALADMLTELEQAGLLEGTAYTSDDLESLLDDLQAVEVPDPGTAADYAETPEEAQARVEGRVHAGQMRELVLVFSIAEHGQVTEWLNELRTLWRLERNADVVHEALRLAVQA